MGGGFLGGAQETDDDDLPGDGPGLPGFTEDDDGPAVPKPIGFEQPISEDPNEVLQVRSHVGRGPDIGGFGQTRPWMDWVMSDGYYPQDLDDIIGSFGIAERYSIKDLMIRSGLLSATSALPGDTFGDGEKTAFKELLGISNRQGFTWNRTLADMARMAPPGGGPSGPGRAPFKPRTPNRNEVKRAYRDIRKRMLGGQFTRTDDQAFEAEQEAFADAFEAQVVGAQRAAYEGRAVEEPPSLEAAAMDTLEEDQAAGVKAFSFAGLASAMTRALGGT